MSEDKRADVIAEDNKFYEGDDFVGERPENLEEVNHDETDG